MAVLDSLKFQKSPSIRVKLQVILESVITKLGSKVLGFKENISIMTYLVAFLQDASEKVRDQAKKVLDTLKKTLGDRNLEKLITNT